LEWNESGDGFGSQVEAFETVYRNEEWEMGCFDDVAIKFDKSSPGKNITEWMECPFDEI